MHGNIQGFQEMEWVVTDCIRGMQITNPHTMLWHCKLRTMLRNQWLFHYIAQTNNVALQHIEDSVF